MKKGIILITLLSLIIQLNCFSGDGDTPITPGTDGNGGDSIVNPEDIDFGDEDNDSGSGGDGDTTPLIQVKAPDFSPHPSQYSSQQTVTITSATDNSTIYYTLDGTAPSADNGLEYSEPIEMPLDSTLKAVALKDGMADSDISVAQYNDPDWALKIFGGTGNIFVCTYGITTDSENNIYISGSAYSYGESVIDFDPSTGEDISTPNGSNIFVTKIKADGTYYWSRRFGQGQGLSIAVDSRFNVYVVGFCNGTSNFNFEGSDIHTAKGAKDIFITRINSNGSYGWTNTFGGDSDYQHTDWGRYVTVDKEDNVYLTGKFSGTVDFDPGDGEDIRTCSIDSIYRSHMRAFLTKYNSDGSYGWTYELGDHEAMEGSAEGYEVKVDNGGNIYVAGLFTGTVDFNPETEIDNRISRYGTDIFVTKINADKSYGWTIAMGSVSGNCAAKSLCIDKNSNIFVAGYFMGKVNFNQSGGTDNRTSSSSGNMADIFIMKIDSDGTYNWTRTIEGNADTMSIDVDTKSNIYFTGWYVYNTDFDPTSGVDIKAGSSVTRSTNMFTTKLTDNGQYGWTKIFEGTKEIHTFNSNYSYAVTVDGMDNVITTGFFTCEVDFDPTENKNLVIPAGNPGAGNAFIRKFTP